jgi:hypothetical protein
MHEVGHNLGLGHSGEGLNEEYGDRTGVMGGAPSDDDLKMCPDLIYRSTRWNRQA